METKQIRVTDEAYNNLRKLAKLLTDELGVPVNLTYAASVAINDAVERRLERQNESDTGRQVTNENS